LVKFTMAQVNLISQAEYAKHRGCSEAAVSKAISKNRISLIDGKIDPTVADMQWAKNTRVRAGSGRPPGAGTASTEQLALVAPTEGSADKPAGEAAAPGGDDYWKSRSRREAAEAELAEMDLATKRGELIQVKAVELVWSAALASAREHLLQVRARLAPLLAVESETFQIEQLLDLEHNKALNFLAGVQLPTPGGGS
jgi:hypothetical protein